MQNDFCDSNGALARSGSDPLLTRAMAPRLLRLFDGGRRIGLPIVHVRTEHSPWTIPLRGLVGTAAGSALCAIQGSW